MSYVSSHRRVVSGIAVAAGLLALAPSAFAQNVTVSESLTGEFQSNSITALDFGTAPAAGFVSSSNYTTSTGTSILFQSQTGQPTSGVYKGATFNAAAPYISATSQLTSNYLAAQTNGSVTMNFAAQQKYFGLDWGSQSSHDTLNFYNNGVLVESLNGSQLASQTGSTSNNGSSFVNFNFNNGSFNQVVATETVQPAFEFSSVSYAATVIPASSTGTPQVVTASPAPMPKLGGSLLGFALLGLAAPLVLRSRVAMGTQLG